MNSIAFSSATLTEEQAQEIASAYIRGEKDPPRIAALLQVETFDLNLLMHPLVRRYIVEFQRSLRTDYSLQDHMFKLREIRNAAMDDDNFKVALSAEIQLGKVAGHYDPKPLGDDDNDPQSIDPTKLTTQELRKRLAKAIGATLPPEQLPAPPEPEVDEDSDEVTLRMI